MRSAGPVALLLLLAGCLAPASQDEGNDGGATLPSGSNDATDRFDRSRGTDPAQPEPGSGPASTASDSVPGDAVANPDDVAQVLPLDPLELGDRARYWLECPCPTYSVDLADHVGDGTWLDARLRWNGTLVADMGLRLEGPGATADGLRGFDDRRAQLESPVAGTYLIAINGSGRAELTLRLRSLAGTGETGDLLPNLVTLVPVDPHVDACDSVEATEQGATVCLRLGNGVGNTGHGPLQVRLEYPQSALSFAGLGTFVQEVMQRDGSIRAQAVGAAEFHVSHSHWHYDGLAQFALFPVDADGLRGPAVSSHHKAGFCFLDWNEMPEQETETGPESRAEQDCLVPGATGWTMGITPGWYDFYWADLTDQYVDIAGVPDGVYELVSSADSLDTLEEMDETDNQASVVVKLSGTTVTVLEERGHYRVLAEDREL